MSAPRRVLDLFCGVGGAAMGLHRAWPKAKITGVDLHPQKNYPFNFVQANALELSLEWMREFDFIWASPPCQAYSVASISQRKNGRAYPDLVTNTRLLLNGSGKLWAMENVPRSPLRADMILCGSQFGLRIVRHRIFELGFSCFQLLPPCQHAKDVICVVGHGTTTWARRKNHGKCHTVAQMRDAMQIDWMNRDELSQAVPPAYSEFIARQVRFDD